MPVRHPVFTRLTALLLTALSLAACGAQPHPTLWGGDQSEVTRDGRRYVVIRKGNLVEVIRLGWASPGEHHAIRETMIALVPEVTGCRLRLPVLSGDSGEMRARVSCPRR